MWLFIKDMACVIVQVTIVGRDGGMGPQLFILQQKYISTISY